MRRKIPSSHSLLCFEAAAKHSSYTHAALELSMTQSAVSRQIQQLEDFLGLRLFHRTRHGVELTLAGQHYYKSIRPYLMGLERTTLDLMSHKGQGGTLKIGVVPTFATRWLLPRLHRFNHLYPEITIHLETSTKPFLFHDNIFDAAIYAGTAQQIEQWAGTQTYYLMQEEVVPVCSAQFIQQHFPTATKFDEQHYQLTAEQLIQLPLLQQTTRPSIWQEWFQSQNIDHPNAYEGQQHELFSMLAVAATHHMGMALIPKMFIEKELQQHDLVIASTQKIAQHRCYYFVHSHEDKSALIQKFATWLQDEIQVLN